MIQTLVLKVAARCNIACTYCYEYSAGDQTWRGKPRFLDPNLARHLGQRIREYGEARQVNTMNIVAHGGEPLMLGARRLDTLFHELQEGAGPVQLSLSLQTNGLLLDREICDVLARRRVMVGVSLDGGLHENRHRVDFKGENTWARAVEGIHLLREHYPGIWGGILSVIDLETDPVRTLDALCTYEPPQLDLLQPYTTHDMAGVLRKQTAQRFGKWMREAMQYWLDKREYGGIRIRVFEDALQASVSGRPRTDWFGPRRVGYLVVETDGAYDVLDQLKVIGGESASFRAIRSTVERMSILEAEDMARALLAEHGANRLPADCEGCRWSGVCGAGHLTSRHSVRRGFDNRSVYCEGIASLLDTARQKMDAYVAQQG
jgi:uncharacterized protein